MRLKWLAPGLVIVALSFLGSCTSPSQVACTNIGCSGGLSIELEGPTEDAYTVTVRSEGREPQVIECTVEEPCQLFFPDYAPASVTVTYESSEKTVEHLFHPEYEVRHPNGEDCPPACVTGALVLQLGS